MSRDPRPEPRTPPKEPEKAVDREDARKAKHERRERGPLDPWERYRALDDAYRIGQDLVEFADRKVRFGLIVIGAINVVVFGAALRGETALLVPAAWRPWVLAYLGLYAIVLVQGVGHALSALRPRINPLARRLEEARGLHFYDDVLARELPEYERAWRELSLRQLSSLMAEQTYALATINRGKFDALGRMYRSIRLMLVMAAGLLMVAVTLVFSRTDPVGSAPRAAAIGLDGGLAGVAAADSREYKLMLVPARFGDASPDGVRAAIVSFWRLADVPPIARVDLPAVERQTASGPGRRRLLTFLDGPGLASDACRPPGDGGFLFDCAGLVLRSRVDVKPYAKGQALEVDPGVGLPVELTLKSRATSALAGLPERRITAAGSAGGAPVDVRTKLEKDMAVGRTTWGQSASVQMRAEQARRAFTATTASGLAVGVPADLVELQRLFEAPMLRGVANRPLRAAGPPAYEEAWTARDALLLPGGERGTLTMSLWYDLDGVLKVVEASWRLRKGMTGGLGADAVGASEQLLDHLAAAAARDGWFDADAPLKKSQALTDGE